MILVELYSKKDCHLCDVAKAVIRRAQSSVPFLLKEINLKEGDELYENFKNDFPVILMNKNLAYKHRVPEQDFVNKLQLLQNGGR